jgi:hypothetical protein
MISELFRPLVRWVFWNRHRPWVILTVLFLTLVLAVRLSGCAAGGHGIRPAPPRPPSTAATAASPALPSASAPPSAAPTVPAAAASSPPASAPPAAALQVAEVFLQAWVSRSADRAAQIRAVATPQLTAQVTGPGAALSPATVVGGPLTVTGQGPSTVSVSAPTNAGPALLTVRYTGGRWRAAEVMLAKTGD